MNDRLHINAGTPVGQIARFFPSTIAVFEDLDIEYACKGGRSVRNAAEATGLAPTVLLEEIAAVIGTDVPAPERSLSELLHIIINGHHRFETERFGILSARLVPAAPADKEVARMHRLIADLNGSITTHMLREERSLFPRIEELDLHPHRVRAGSISRPMLNEFVEHDVVHERLAKLRELGLRVRCRRAADDDVLDEVEALSRAIHRHMHIENNVLIPRVIELENRLKSARANAMTT